MYLHQLKKWPQFHWDIPALIPLLASLHQELGRLAGHMETLGFDSRDEAQLRMLTLDVVKNSEIENEILNPEQVRSSLAQRLGIDIGGLIPADRHVEGMVEMMLDATQHYQKPVTKTRLCKWHAALFPTGYSGMHKINIAMWRDDRNGPMRVVSGPIGRERVHFEAPSATKIEHEMHEFLNWVNQQESLDPLVKAGITHLWFLTIHPFEDGNGRIARALTDLQLARADKNQQRFYSMSAQIRKERKEYYDILEKTQKNTLDITEWLIWFLSCLERTLKASKHILADVLQKTRFWQLHNAESFNARQHQMLNKLLNEFNGKLTTTKWAKITKCSQDTALRDIQDLMQRGILAKEPAGGRSTNYLLVKTPLPKV